MKGETELLKKKLEAAENYINAVEAEDRARKELLGLQPNGSVNLYNERIEEFIARVAMAREKWHAAKTKYDMASLPEF